MKLRIGRLILIPIAVWAGFVIWTSVTVPWKGGNTADANIHVFAILAPVVIGIFGGFAVMLLAGAFLLLKGLWTMEDRVTVKVPKRKKSKRKDSQREADLQRRIQDLEQELGIGGH